MVLLVWFCPKIYCLLLRKRNLDPLKGLLSFISMGWIKINFVVKPFLLIRAKQICRSVADRDKKELYAIRQTHFSCSYSNKYFTRTLSQLERPEIYYGRLRKIIRILSYRYLRDEILWRGSENLIWASWGVIGYDLCFYERYVTCYYIMVY